MPVSTSWYPHPSGGDGGESTNPDTGKDLHGIVPNLSMHWTPETLPSFNTDPASPTQQGGTGMQTGQVHWPTPGETVSVGLAAFRAAETDMLRRTATCVSSYETLKTAVTAAISGDAIFGQHDTDRNWHPEQGAVMGGSPGGSWQNDDSPLQGSAQEFARQINPIQQRALARLGDALETIGQYIGSINTTGQVYAKIDRSSRFPAPPATGGH